VNGAARRPVRDDGLSHTTLRIGSGLSAATVAAVIQALQRVPGVLTADEDAERAQALVAHDSGVPIAALVAAANRAGAAAEAEAVAASHTLVASVAGRGAPQRRARRRSVLAAVSLAAILAFIVMEIALPESPDKRWLFVVPLALFWAFIFLQGTRSRRS
jgi:cation transport ATPase